MVLSDWKHFNQDEALEIRLGSTNPIRRRRPRDKSREATLGRSPGKRCLTPNKSTEASVGNFTLTHGTDHNLDADCKEARYMKM